MGAKMYEEEIKALVQAIASGTTSVTFRDRTVNFASFDELVARLNYLRGNQGQNWRNRGVSPDTSKGLNGKCGCDE